MTHQRIHLPETDMNLPYSRRRFLVAASALTAAAALDPRSEALAADALPTIPIIDPHQHLWDLKRFRLLWLADTPQLNHSYLLSDYKKETAGLDVDKTVYMEVDLDPTQQDDEAQFVIETARQRGAHMAGGVISGRPAQPEFADYIRKYQGNRYIKGVRQILHPPDRPRGLCLQPQFVKSVQLLGDLGMRYDICIRPDELMDGVKLVDQCPKTRFVLDHCGNAEVDWDRDNPARAKWFQGITAMAKRRSVICKISGIVKTTTPGMDKARQMEPYIQHCLQSFGPDRVMFASDWPVCTFKASLKEWVAALWTIVRNEPAADQRRLFHDNAATFYDLG
jgi:L-fuconolactonase